MEKGATIFAIVEDPTLWKSILSLSKEMGHQALQLESADQLHQHCTDETLGCVIASLSSVQACWRFLNEGNPPLGLPVVVAAEQPGTATVVEMMKRGAITMFDLPCKKSDLREAITEAVERHAKERQQRLEKRQFLERINRLSEKELEVMELMLEGLPNKVIASRLGVSMRTVETRRHNVFVKMEVANIADLVRVVVLARAK